MMKRLVCLCVALVTACAADEPVVGPRDEGLSEAEQRELDLAVADATCYCEFFVGGDVDVGDPGVCTAYPSGAASVHGSLPAAGGLGATESLNGCVTARDLLLRYDQQPLPGFCRADFNYCMTRTAS